jgi:signal transduction histidine kinase
MSRFAAAIAGALRRYAGWLVAISWKRFILLSVLLLIIAGVASNIPPFTWVIMETAPKVSRLDTPVEPTPEDAEAGASLGEEIKREVIDEIRAGRKSIRRVRLGDYLPNLAFLFIIVSAAIKIAYAGRVKAEAKAAEAQEMADAESLKRQVVEARMAAMQAQVEPHFLFNTLASIDHLIEVDPPRASRMQKNLIALLRASMPAMREAATTLGRELQVVRPYLEILKVRMEDRLRAEINVAEGLYSADFPPMMLQSLVENAIKHGLEPKPEGGTLRVEAEVAHGKLVVSVADTGVGFGRAATVGTGTGLNSIRERLKLIYGPQAELRIAENSPTGTRVSVVVPYKTA